MPFINYAAREIHCKLVYYGPGLSGKTTNAKMIHAKSRKDRRGALISLDTDSDRTLFFDFMPLSIGLIRGFHVRFHIYTVPGQVFYNATRKLIMKGLDGVIFVADSQPERMDANIECFESLHVNLAEQGDQLEEIPYLLQCNKRDLPDPTPLPLLEAELNPYQNPCIEAVASEGTGVFESLRVAAKMTLKNLR